MAPGASSSATSHRRSERAPDLGRGLACPQQRARHDELRWVREFRQALPEILRLLDAARRQLAQLVGLARRGFSVSAEVEAHRRQDRRNARFTHP